jgi:outer membrane protein assembly factor BamB
MHGFGTSPIVYGNLVILFDSQQATQLRPGDKPGRSAMLAFDRRTGSEVWRTERVSTVACYTVPCIFEPPGGPPELIGYSNGDGMFSLDPLTGRQNWALDIFDKRTVSSPVIAGGLLFGSTGSGGGGNYVAAVRPGTQPELVYKIERLAPYVPTCVARGDLMFLFYDKGIVTCFNARDGKEYWHQRLDTAFSGSPVLVRDKLYCIDEGGVVIVLAADKEFHELARNPLGESSRSTPAVAGGRMYLRTLSHLICVGGDRL